MIAGKQVKDSNLKYHFHKNGSNLKRVNEGTFSTMSAGNYQQKKSRPASLIPKDDVLGKGDEPNQFYQAARPETVAIYEKNKLSYKNTPEQDAEEMFFDRIMSPDGDFLVQRTVIVLKRYKTYDEQEWLLIQEELQGRTPIGNLHRYVKQRDISEHDEPEIEQRMIPGTGEQIRKKGESVLYHKTRYDIPFNPDTVAEAMTRVKEPLRLQLYAHEQGQRPWRIKDKKIWLEYTWPELMEYCRTGETKESKEEKLLQGIKGLSAEGMMKVMGLLVEGAKKVGVEISMTQTQAPTPTIEDNTVQFDTEEKEPKTKGKK